MGVGGWTEGASGVGTRCGEVHRQPPIQTRQTALPAHPHSRPDQGGVLCTLRWPLGTRMEEEEEERTVVPAGPGLCLRSALMRTGRPEWASGIQKSARTANPARASPDLGGTFPSELRWGHRQATTLLFQSSSDPPGSPRPVSQPLHSVAASD